MSTSSLNPPTHVIGLDPSLRKLGISLYSLTCDKTLWAMQVSQPSESHTDWQQRAIKMATTVSVALVQAMNSTDFDPGDGVEDLWLVSETPDNWFSEKGIDSKNAGDIQKLYWFVGMMVSNLRMCALEINLRQIWTVVPKAWKGQTPKPIMEKRAARWLDSCGICPEKPIPDDAAEAVLLARIAAEKFRTNPEEGKGWARLWSNREGRQVDRIKIQLWDTTAAIPRIGFQGRNRT